MTSIENEEWVEIENFAAEKLKYEQYAAAALDLNAYSRPFLEPSGPFLESSGPSLKSIIDK